MKVDVGEGLTVDVAINQRGNPPGKLADATLYFTAGPLAGLCILGFGVWERREKPSEINVTMPARQFMSKGEKRSFNLVRITDPNAPDPDATQDVKHAYYAPLDRLRHRISRAYSDVVSMPAAEADDGDAVPDNAADSDIPF